MSVDVVRAILVPAFALLTLSVASADNREHDIEAALGLIDEEVLRRHYEILASDAMAGRFAGTPGYDAAAEYVAEQFALAGAEAGGDEGWYQQVPLVSYRVESESTSVFVHRDGADRELRYREDYGMAGDKVRESNALRAEVVYVGFGVHAPELGYSDYEGIDVDGKIIARFGGAPATFPHNQRAYYASSRNKAAEAIRRGAVGSIVLRSRRAERIMSWERYKRQTGTRPGMAWVNLSGEVSDYFPELGGAITVNREVATRLFEGSTLSFEDALDAIDDDQARSTPLGIEVSMSRRSSQEEILSPNVIATIKGSDPALADEYVVFTAHLDGLGTGPAEDGDSIYNGAYDNAMGVALLLEAARVFAELPPRRSVMFIALTAEERGLLGSDYFAHYPTVPRDAIVANVNLDMPLFMYPPADLVAFGAEHSSLQDPVQRAAEAEGFELTPDPLPEETLFIRSDQYSFVRKGTPAIFLVTGFNSADPELDGAALFREHLQQHYHRPSDDLELTVHWESAVRFARANARIAYLVGDAEDRPTWNPGDFFGEKFGRQRASSD
ncbi:MAG: M28 family peptidase [Pseudomonadota bacterium]